MILQLRQTNQRHHSTEGWWLVKHVKGQSHQAQLTKRWRKGCKQKNYCSHITPLRLKTQRCWENREPNQTRSKPNPVSQPIRTARTFVHLYNGTQYYSTETVLVIFPFLQTITSQMWPSWGSKRVVNFTNSHGARSHSPKLPQLSCAMAIWFTLWHMRQMWAVLQLIGLCVRLNWLLCHTVYNGTFPPSTQPLVWVTH